MRLGFLGKLFLSTLTILAIPYVVTGVSVDGPLVAAFAAFVLLVFNWTVKPLLIVLTLPLTVLTLGLFLFVVNAMVFGLVAAVVPGIHVTSFWSALGASLMMSAVTWLLNLSTDEQGGQRVIIVRGGQTGRSDGPRMKDVN